MRERRAQQIGKKYNIASSYESWFKSIKLNQKIVALYTKRKAGHLDTVRDSMPRDTAGDNNI